MTRDKQTKILNQVKLDRAARRTVELETGACRVTGKVFLTSKRDRQGRKSVPNTVRGY